MARFENVTPAYSMDGALFDAQYARFDPSQAMSDEMVFLLSLCKVNAAEAYGVERTAAVAERHARETGSDTEMRLLVEEHYHTRILLSAALEYGLHVQGVYQPSLSLRALISGCASRPGKMMRPTVLVSELLGTLLFSQMFVKAGEVLASKPELRDRIQERIVEILIDEIGHVTFNQLCLSAWGMFQARRMLPLVVIGMGKQYPEMSPLGMGLTTDLTWLKRMPSEVMRRAFFVREVSAYRGTRIRDVTAAE